MPASPRSTALCKKLSRLRGERDWLPSHAINKTRLLPVLCFWQVILSNKLPRYYRCGHDGFCEQEAKLSLGQPIVLPRSRYLVMLLLLNNILTSPAVFEILDPKRIQGSRVRPLSHDVIGHATIRFLIGHFLLVFFWNQPLSLTVSEIFNGECDTMDDL